MTAMYFYKMNSIKNIIVTGSEGRPMATDIFYEQTGGPKPVVIYAHGFNGFKDWGNFDLIATQFAQAGFVFVKFNFSHNGTTPEQPTEFVDLEAFRQNNYTKQLNDLRLIIDWVSNDLNPHSKEMDLKEIYVCGHSMGGGICILKAAEDSRIKKIVTWASVSECKTPWGNWPAEKMMEWKQAGVQYYLNSRTKQQMPLYYQLFQDYQNNGDRLDIKKAIANLQIPVLICHGTWDTSVPVKNAYLLNEWQPASKFLLVESDHVFGRKHPWEENTLPVPMQEVINGTIEFFRPAG